MVVSLPDVSFGDGAARSYSNARTPDLAIDDDAIMEKTPQSVIDMLGFDPLGDFGGNDDPATLPAETSPAPSGIAQNRRTLDEFSEGDHPREANGEFVGPGKAAIPAGMMRRFHYTPNANIAAIRKEGLKISHSTGRAVGDPIAVWSNPTYPYGPGEVPQDQSVVEFYHDPKNYEANPIATSTEVPPENIVAIHEPWHETYNAVKRGRVKIENLRRAAKPGAGNEKYIRALHELDTESHRTHDASEDFKEAEHPRANDGKFKKGGGAAPKIPAHLQKNVHFVAIKNVMDLNGASDTAKIEWLQNKITSGGMPASAEDFAKAWINHLTPATEEKEAPPAKSKPPKKPDGDSIGISANDAVDTIENMANDDIYNVSAKIGNIDKRMQDFASECGYALNSDEWKKHPVAKYGEAWIKHLMDSSDDGFEPEKDTAKQTTKAEPPSYSYNPNWSKTVQKAMIEIQDAGDDPDLSADEKLNQIATLIDDYAAKMGTSVNDGVWNNPQSVVGKHAKAWGEYLGGDKPTASKKAPPPASKPADKPLHQKQDAPISVADWKKTGGQLGSNTGGQYTAPNGDKFYVKLAKSPDHARNEHLASKLYELIGAPILPVKLVNGGDIGGSSGSIGTATKWQEQTPIDLDSDADRKAAGKHFATHALLANWDAAGTGGGQQLNQAKINGEMHSIDLGGSLSYRAQGAPKGAAFGNTVPEWDSLRDPDKNKNSAKLFGSMSNQELFDSAKHVANADPQKIFETVIQHGQGSYADRMTMADKILARRDDVIARANKLGLGQVHKEGD